MESKPEPLEVLPEGIPDVLKQRDQWVLWRYKTTDKDKWTKVPHQANGYPASSTDSGTWTTFETAYAVYMTQDFDGIGFVFTEDDPLVAVDLDAMSADLLAEARQLDSYTEVSPSGNGLHVIARGLEGEKIGHNQKPYEMYTHARYLTITGQVWEQNVDVHDRDKELRAFYERHFEQRAEPAQSSIERLSPTMEDQEILDLAFRFENKGERIRALYEGDETHPVFARKSYDTSALDQSLIEGLVFVTQDEDQVERLMRSSARVREKWDTRRGDTTWLRLSIKNQLEKQEEVYSVPEPVFLESGDIREKLTHKPPVFPEDAYYGIIGKTIAEIVPHTQASAPALMLDLLTSIGNLIGPEVHVDYHRPQRTNLYGMVVGPSAGGSKGTSRSQIQQLLDGIDAEWLIEKGLTSGEGLARAFMEAQDHAPEFGPDFIDYKPVRMFAYEAEFGKLMKRSGWSGSTLSHVLRELWDELTVEKTTSKNAIKVDGAFLSLVGHVTPSELTKLSTDVDKYGGFLNRFLYVWSEGKYVPFGTKPDTYHLRHKLETALDIAKKFVGHVPVSPSAVEFINDLDRAHYENIKDADVMTARSTANMVRIATIHALMNGYEMIRVEHLEAAKAFTDYSAQVMKYVFRMDDVTRKIIHLLQDAGPAGMRRSTFYSKFGNNLSAQELESILDDLMNVKLVKVRKEKSDGPGRPPTTYVWIGK